MLHVRLERNYVRDHQYIDFEQVLVFLCPFEWGSQHNNNNNNTQQDKIDTNVSTFVYLCSSYCNMFRPFILGQPQAIHNQQC
jgi:hypothetical protein